MIGSQPTQENVVVAEDTPLFPPPPPKKIYPERPPTDMCERLDAILGKDKWEIVVKGVKRQSYYHYGKEGQYWLQLKYEAAYPRYVHTFCCESMAANCGILVIHGAATHGGFHQKGIGQIMNEYYRYLAGIWGYSIVLITDKENHDFNRKLVVRNKWTDIFDFINRRSKNRVFISVFPVDQIGEYNPYEIRQIAEGEKLTIT